MRSLHKIAMTAALLAGTAQVAYAVPSGTDITNTVSLSYTSGGNTIEVDDIATSTFTVDRKIDLAVTGLNAGALVNAERAQDLASLSWMIENLGNDPQGFDINVTDTGPLGLTYDAMGSGNAGTWWVVISDNATPGAGTEAPYDIVGTNSIGDILPEGMFYVHIYASIPETAASLSSRDFLVAATVLDEATNDVTVESRGNGINAVDVVFADPAPGGTEQFSQTLQILAPELSATKTVTVISENLDGTFNCASGSPVVGAEAAVPGACVEYTITVTNSPTASAPAVDVEITDALPTNLTFVSLNQGTFDSAVHNSGTITAGVDPIAVGGSASLTIRATVGE